MDEHMIYVDSVVDAIAPYRELLEQFVRGEVTALEVETRYLQIRRETITWMHQSEDVYETTAPFFHAVDDYVDDPKRRPFAFWGIGPEELKEAAVALLAEANLEAAGNRPKVPNKPWVVEDPVVYLDQLIRERLAENRPVGLFEFHTHHLGPFDDVPWSEKRAVFMTVAEGIVQSGAARLTWDTYQDHRTSRNAESSALHEFDAWRWPWQAGDPQDVEFLTLTPPGFHGPLTARQLTGRDP